MYSGQPITVSRSSTEEERQEALYQIYAQVLERQPYSFEHKLLAKAEQDFLRDKIGVRRFLKILGQSEVYLNEFYRNSSNMKFLELCFKHFMGRAPRDREEMQHYCDILMRNGVNKLITEMIDSEEYRKHFGCFTVPHPDSETTYASPKAFLETDILNHELHGRRGWVVPTIVWHELHMNCDGGECRVDQAGGYASHRSAMAAGTAPRAASRQDLIKALRTMKAEDLEEFAADLLPEQRAKLKQILMQPA